MSNSVKKYRVDLVSRSVVKDFIETWHYSKSINGLSSQYCFGLFDDDELIGAMIYGRLAMGGVARSYGQTDESMIELRRLCCIDNTPRNTESYFIGQTLKWLKQNTSIRMVISYADPYYGHQGIIYKASNFQLVGETAKARHIIYEGRKYHDKAIRTKYKGKLKPFAQRIKDALDAGEAHYVKTPGKNIYTYDLDIRRK